MSTEDVIRKAAGHGGALYDIGAHYGWFTAAWLKHGGDFVEAFEPLAENRAILAQTLSGNGWQAKARIHETAVGSKNGSDELVSYPGDTSRTFICQPDTIHSVPSAAQLRLEVPICTLSTLVRDKGLQSPALVKIDVEGLEGDVIEGAVELLAREKPPVIIEVHNISNGLRTGDQLGKLGYQMHILGAKGRKKSLCLVLWMHPDNLIS